MKNEEKKKQASHFYRLFTQNENVNTLYIIIVTKGK